MLVYAATLSAKLVDELQHSSALMVSHEHEGISAYSIKSVHGANDEYAAQHADSEAPADDNIAGGHNHHGDSGPNLLAADVPIALAMTLSAGLHIMGKDRPISGLRSLDPERPPRTTLQTA